MLGGSKFQAPSSKLQTPEKFQLSNTEPAILAAVRRQLWTAVSTAALVRPAVPESVNIPLVSPGRLQLFHVVVGLAGRFGAGALDDLAQRRVHVFRHATGVA